MKTLPILFGLSCTALLLTACEYDDEGYGARSVSVSTGGAYYGGDYDEYSPYYSYSDRRYYRTGNRYVYYRDSRPYYVTALPSGAHYITPRRGDHRSSNSVRSYRQEPSVHRYDTTSERRSYESRSDRSDRSDQRDREGYASEQRATQTRIQSDPSRDVRREREPARVQVQNYVPPSSSREIRREISPSKVRVQSNEDAVKENDGRPDKRKKQKDD